MRLMKRSLNLAEVFDADHPFIYYIAMSDGNVTTTDRLKTTATSTDQNAVQKILFYGKITDFNVDSAIDLTKHEEL